jgi:hypothetical protein
MTSEEERQAAEEKILGPALTTQTLDPAEIVRRNHLRADFELVFIRDPRGPAVLAEIARICHFMDSSETVQDMALQNAFRTILHHLGRWSDDKGGADDFIARLLKE